MGRLLGLSKLSDLNARVAALASELDGSPMADVSFDTIQTIGAVIAAATGQTLEQGIDDALGGGAADAVAMLLVSMPKERTTKIDAPEERKEGELIGQSS